jgi:hypothetical protein
MCNQYLQYHSQTFQIQAYIFVQLSMSMVHLVEILHYELKVLYFNIFLIIFDLTNSQTIYISKIQVN